MGGEDRNGLKLDEKLANFFKFSCCLEKIESKLLWFARSLLNFICYLRSYAGAFLVQLKVLSKDFKEQCLVWIDRNAADCP